MNTTAPTPRHWILATGSRKPAPATAHEQDRTELATRAASVLSAR